MTILSNTNYEWRLELLRQGGKIGEATFKSCTVDYVENADVMRTMKAMIPVDGFHVENIRIKQDEEYIYFDGTRCFDGSWCFSSINGLWIETENSFDMFADRLRPVMSINGTDYPLGVFMIVAAPIEDDGKERCYNVEAYDETMVLKQSAVTMRRYFVSSTTYLSALNTLIASCGLSRIMSDNTAVGLHTAREYAVGTQYLSIINELLSEINYAPIHAGANGYLYLEEKKTKIVADFVYTDENSKLIDTIKTDTDIYSLPNVIVGYTSSPDTNTVLKYKRTNSNPGSAISTVKRGYNVVETIELSDCPDYATLQQVVDSRFEEASQATETATITTMPDGDHMYGTYVSLGQNGTNALYREVGWSIEFGGQMTHNLERKVFI